METSAANGSLSRDLTHPDDQVIFQIPSMAWTIFYGIFKSNTTVTAARFSLNQREEIINNANVNKVDVHYGGHNGCHLSWRQVQQNIGIRKNVLFSSNESQPWMNESQSYSG